MAQIIKRGNTYTIRVSNKYDIDKNQRKRNFTWKPDPGMTPKQEEKELARQVALFEEQVRTGRFINGNIKFAAFAEKWMADYAEMQLAPKTIHRYKSLLTRINKAIGHIRLDQLQPTHLIEFYDNLAEKGIRNDLKYRATDEFSKKVKDSFKTTELVSKADLSTSTVYAALQGRSICESSAKSICKAFEGSLSDCFKPVTSNSKLSSRTILHHHRVISSILETAVHWQVILSNPADRVKAPRVIRSESKCLDEIQSKKLVELLQAEPIQYRTMIILLIYTGIRRGELCGLQWSDIDFKNRVLHVQRALQYLPKQGLFVKEPKSSSSKRAIKLSVYAIQLLKEYKVWQSEERLRLGDRWQQEEREKAGDNWKDPEFIFTRWNGSPFNPDDLTKWFRSFNREHDLPQVNIHSLRHTNATLMIAGGTDIRTVSKRLGHAQTSTTANIYAHAIQSADEAAAETLENILDPKSLSTRSV